VSAVEDPFKCLTQIGEQVEPVSHLYGVRRAGGCPTDIFRRAVAGDDGDAGMVA
jgi:hypothetical protein